MFIKKQLLLTTKIYNYAIGTELQSYNGFTNKLKGVFRNNVQRLDLDANLVKQIIIFYYSL